MNNRRMGRTGLQVSEVCLGTMTFGKQADETASFRIMDVADAAGVNFFDTADMYPLGVGVPERGETERIIGKWLKARGARDRVVLATKGRTEMGDGPNDAGLSRKHLLSAIEASLKRLGTDHVDLYQVHYPDADTPIDETLEALDTMLRRGYVRYLGCSNYPAWQIAEGLLASQAAGLARFDCVQPRYNVLFRMIEDEILPLARSQGLGVIVFNPLAGGMLTGRYLQSRTLEENSRFTLPVSGAGYQKRYWKDPIFDAVSRLGAFLAPRGKSLTHAAIAWTLAQDGITSAIVGASKPEQLEDSLRAVHVKLEPDELEFMDGLWFDLPKERDPLLARR